MIQSFHDKDTAKIHQGQYSKRFARELQKKALVRLMWLEAASAVEDLRFPLPNRLEALSGDRKGFYSIRVNDQSRVVFCLEDGDAYDVQLTDSH